LTYSFIDLLFFTLTDRIGLSYLRKQVSTNKLAYLDSRFRGLVILDHEFLQKLYFSAANKQNYLCSPVKDKLFKCWDGQGTSYTPDEDKMYGLGSVSEAKEAIQGQGLAPAAAGPIKKIHY